MSRFDSLFLDHLAGLDQRHSRRFLRSVVPEAGGRLRRGGLSYLNFSSNDYLGLAHHPLLIARAREWAESGTSAAASRLVTGSLAQHEQVEHKLAAFKGTEAALIFNSGWQANAAILPALFDRAFLGTDALVFTDRLIHASLHHGCDAAGIRQIRFRHNDLGHLEDLLRARIGQPGRRFIITESVFSMDGDQIDPLALAALAQRYDAFLYLDEAHATGVLGPQGRGLSALIPGQVDCIMGTFSKALGGFGAYVAGSRALCDFLINRCSGFIYATALPPAVLGAMDAALDLVPQLDALRDTLAQSCRRVHTALDGLGIDRAGSTTQIIPAIAGSAESALFRSRSLEQRGILAIPIRPPTVPPGGSRLRFALSATHQPADIDQLIAAIAEIWSQL